jgi:molybdopterin molybdotransferase
MSLFLQVVSVSHAIGEIRNLAVPCRTESVPLIEAFHRILAQDVHADGDIPGFTRSVVDGFAVRSPDTTGSSDAIPSLLNLKGRILMGDPVNHVLLPGDCIYVPTGGILPEGADAVVMIEHTDRIEDQVLIKKPVAPGENVLLFNEDFSAGEVVVRRGKRLTAQDIGVLAAAGCTDVPVSVMPRIGIISTGNELVPVNARPAAGQVRDVNSSVIASVMKDWGCHTLFYGIVRDDRDALREVIGRSTAECDAVLISGGSSKDDRDMVAAIIAEKGRIVIHGIAIAPGKPTIIGECEGKPVIGLPGHPASAFIVLIAIVRHLISAMTGETGSTVPALFAVLGQNVPSSKGREDYVRVAVKEGVATPLFGKSGLLNTLVRSTGVVRVPAESEGLEAGTQVEVIMW